MSGERDDAYAAWKRASVGAAKKQIDHENAKRIAAFWRSLSRKASPRDGAAIACAASRRTETRK